MNLAITRVIRKHHQRGFADYQVELTDGVQAFVFSHVSASAVRSYGFFAALVPQAILEQAGLIRTFRLECCEDASRAAIRLNWKRYIRERLVIDDACAQREVAP